MYSRMIRNVDVCTYIYIYVCININNYNYIYIQVFQCVCVQYVPHMIVTSPTGFRS